MRLRTILTIAALTVVVFSHPKAEAQRVLPTLSVVSAATVEIEEGEELRWLLNVVPHALRDTTVTYAFTFGDTISTSSVLIPEGYGPIVQLTFEDEEDEEIEPPRETLILSLLESDDYILADPTSVTIIIKEGVCDRSAPVRDALANGFSCFDVTEDDLSTITDLSLVSANLAELKERDFLNLGALRSLDLSRNRLSRLPENVFSPLVSLEELFLSENALTTLPASVFSELAELRVLNLHHNRLIRLPRDVFSPLVSLEELTLSTNRLTALPERVFAGLSNLRSLWLGNNVPGGSFDTDGNAVLTLDFIKHENPANPLFGVFAGLTLREGAPFNMQIILRPQGVSLSSDRVMLAAGDVHSSVFTVIQTQADAAVALIEPQLPGDVCDRTQQRCYQGFRVAAGAPFDPAAPPPPFPEPTLSLADMTVEVEEGGTAEITINVSPFAPRNVVVHYVVGGDGDTADAGNDFSDPANGVVTIPKGALTGTIRIVVSDDTKIEPTREAFTVSLAEGDYYTLASPDIMQVIIKEGVCDRSAPVREALANGLSCFDVTDARLSAVTDLDISSANLAELKERDFLNLGALTTLDLSRNRLSRLPASVFSPTASLESLFLNGNALKMLPAGVFSGLNKLRVLNLHHNRLQLSPGVFSSLGVLTELSLSENELTALPTGVFSGLNALQILNLHGNRLQLSSGIFSSLSVLTELSLSENELKGLPENVFSELAELRVLNLHGNRFIELSPGVFSSLGVLTELSLNENNLMALPPGMFSSLNALQVLNLHGNRLIQLPPGAFSSLGVLTELSLSENELTTLPASVFSELAELRVLNLHNNRLIRLPRDVFSSLVSLEELTLSTNRLTALPERVFAGLSKLQSLWLGNNVPGGSFDTDGNAVLTLDFIKHENPANPLFGVFAGLTLREGAPFNMQIILRPQGVSLSSDRVMLAAGDVHSSVFTVIQTQADAAVALIEPQLPGDVCDRTQQRCYQGFRVAAGAPFDPAAPPPPFPEPTLSLTRTVAEVEEGETAEITVDVSPFAPRDVVVHYAVGGDGDTADAGDDFSDPNNGVVTIPKGALTGTIRIVVSDDTKIEPTREAFTVSLAEGDYYTLASSNIMQVIIKEGVCDRSAPVRDALANGLSCFDVTDARLSAVTDLDISSANLAELKERDFLNLGALRTLDLSRNRLRQLPASVFSPLTSLESLFLNGNDLETLPAGVFSGLNKLRVLNLHHNRLNQLPRGVFLSLTSLEELTLSTNRLTVLPGRIFAGLSNLQSLWLGNNMPGESFDGDGDGVLTLEIRHRGFGKSTSTVSAGLRLRQGAPFDMEIALETEGAMLSSTEVTLATGDVDSDVFTVTQFGSAATVTLTAPPIPDDVCDRTRQRCYQGFRIVAGEPFDPAAAPPSVRLRIKVFLEGALE